MSGNIMIFQNGGCCKVSSFVLLYVSLVLKSSIFLRLIGCKSYLNTSCFIWRCLGIVSNSVTEE